MQIQISLNTHAVDAGDIRVQLDAELHALEQSGVKITTNKRETEAGALGVFEAYQFIIEHGRDIVEALPLITAALQISNTVLKRRGLSRKPKPRKEKGAHGANTTAPQPLIVFNVNGNSIELPADDAQLKRYVGTIGKSPAKRTPSSRARKSGTKKSAQSKHKARQ
jgi:hypothetical protein